jgi:hypothetical protein
MERGAWEQRLARCEALVHEGTAGTLGGAQAELQALQQALAQGRVRGAASEEAVRALQLRLDACRAELQASLRAPPVAGKQRILQVQHQVLAEQDRALDDIAATLGRVGQISTGIHDEVNLHAGLLDDLEEGVARGNESVAQAASHAHVVNTTQSGTCKLWVAIVALFIILVLLLSL